MGGVRSVFHGVGLCTVAGVLLCGVAAVRGQDLSVSPTGWDYGNVVVGTSETVTFNLESMGPSAVWTYVIALNETPDFDPPYANPHSHGWPTEDPTYSLGAFSFNPLTLGFLPREMPIGEVYPIDITFAPLSPGYYSVYLGVHSNDSIDPPGPYAFFLLEGTGVPPAVPVPGALLLVGLGTGVVGLMRRRMA